MSRFLVATTGYSVPLSGGETYVGTDPAVQIPVMAEMGLKPRHFVIAPREGGWQLAAVEWAMVLVNGLQVSQTEIHDGDQIVAGQLALTYRDEQEAARGQAKPILMHTLPSPVEAEPNSTSQNSLPSLHQGLSQSEGARQSGWSLPEQQPESGHEPASCAESLPDGWARSFLRRLRDHLWISLVGVLLICSGAVLANKIFAEKPTPVEKSDLVFIKGEIIDGVKMPQKVGNISYLDGIQGIDVVPVLTQPTGKHVWHSLLKLPDDLPYDPAWKEPGNVAVIGIQKKYYDAKQMFRTWSFATTVATLEVNGKSYRSLSQLNAAQAEARKQLLPFAGPGMILLGLFFVFLGWEKAKAWPAVTR